MVSTIIKDSCLLASVPNAIGDVGSRMVSLTFHSMGVDCVTWCHSLLSLDMTTDRQLICRVQPRFSDQWVVDKVMFDYVNGGECTCCGFAHIFNPQGLEGMVSSKLGPATIATLHLSVLYRLFVSLSTHRSNMRIRADQCHVGSRDRRRRKRAKCCQGVSLAIR